MISLLHLALAAALAAAAPSADELELLSGSLRPEAREELTRNAGPAESLPLSEVEAEVDLARARVDGHLRLVLQNSEAAPLTEVVLRLYPSAKGTRTGATLSVDDVRIEGQKVRVQTHGSVVELVLPSALAPGARVEVGLAFHGRLQRIDAGEDDPMASSLAAMGLGGQKAKPASGYGTFAVSERGATLVDWYPQLAARKGLAWDKAEPGPLGDVAHADIGNALVTLTVPKGYRVAGPGSALGQHAATGGKERATFALMGLRGTMGLAVLRDADEARGEAAGVRIRASSLNGPEGAQALVGCATEALTANPTRRYGPYPWTDLALAEVPLVGGAGGVELPGLSLIAKAVSASRDGGGALGGMFEFTCHHEVAHQWWQALVGSDPRTAPWVDESLAQFSAVLVAESAAGPQLGRRAGDRALAHNVALNYQGMRMMGIADGRVSKATTQYKSPLQYAGLVYGKAPFFFVKARELLVGDAGLDELLHTYRARYAFREAGPGDFAKLAGQLDPAHAQALEALEQRYIHETHGDEDLPELDPTELMGMTGAGGLGALGGLGGLGGLLGPMGQGSQKDLMDAMRQLEKMMPGLQRMLDQELKKVAPLDAPEEDP